MSADDFRVLFGRQRPSRFVGAALGGPQQQGFIGGDVIEPQGFGSSLQNFPATVTIDEDGITIEDGSLTLLDEFAETVMVASGFTGNWSDFISLGLYNARFASGVVGTIPNGRTSALPYWTVSDEAGTPTAAFQSGGGAKVTFAAIDTTKRFLSDIVPVLPSSYYAVPYTYEYYDGGNASVTLETVITIEWYQADGTTPSAIRASDTSVPHSFGGVQGVISDNFKAEQAPDDAYYARLAIDVSEIDAHDADAFLTLLALGFREVPVRDLSGLIYRVQDLVLDGGSRTRSMSGEGWEKFTGSDTFFDSDPGAAGYRQYREDIGLWFVFDGTQWVSEEIFTTQLVAWVGSNNFSATTSSAHAAGVPNLPGTDIYLLGVDASFFVNGGTALSGSHKWVGTLNKVQNGTNTNTLITTINIDSGASTVHRRITNDIDALLGNGTTYVTYQITWTKTGTPGNLLVAEVIRYRLVST